MEAKENVATMLPQVPLSGPVIKKPANGEMLDIVSDICKFNNSIIDNDYYSMETALNGIYKSGQVDEEFLESVMKEQEDIFYNKSKYENGDTNLLFIVGYSGGGKSTMSNNEKKVFREVIDADKIVLNMDKDDEYFEKLGVFAEKFINGPGKKYRSVGNEVAATIKKMDIVSFRPHISRDLFNFVIDYAKAHKSVKVIMEGVWIYRYNNPEDAKEYAVYIKGTSLVEATRRALKRDRNNGTSGKNAVTRGLHTIGKYILASGDAITSSLTKWQKYYGDRYDSQKQIESERVNKKARNVVKNIGHDIGKGDFKGALEITGKSVGHKAKDTVQKAKKKIMKESVYEYIKNDDEIYMPEYIEESVKDDIINFKTKVDVSRKIRVLSLDIAIMKIKLKVMSKNPSNKFKVNDLKKAIIKKEKEKRSLMKELTPDVKVEVKRLEKEAEKIAVKEFEELEKEMDDEITEAAAGTPEVDNRKQYFANLIETLKVKLSSETDEKKKDEIKDKIKRCEESLSKMGASVQVQPQPQQQPQEQQVPQPAETTPTQTIEPQVVNSSCFDVIYGDLLKEESDDKKLDPELKRVDEIRGDIADLKEKLQIAKAKYEITGERTYEVKMKGIQAKIDTFEEKLKEQEKKIKKIEKDVKESVLTEAANMEEEIKPIVEKLNSLGYKVKYASPGHKHLRKKEDKEPDGVYYNRLYSDARIMFADKYDFKETPKYWHFRDVDGCSYLDISPLKYDDKDGTPDEAFAKWKDDYMKSLKDWVKELEGKAMEESAELTIDSIMENAFLAFDEN